MSSITSQTHTPISFVSENDDGREEYFAVAEKEVRRSFYENLSHKKASKYARKVLKNSARLQSKEYNGDYPEVDHSDQSIDWDNIYLTKLIQNLNVFLVNKGEENVHKQIESSVNYIVKLAEDCWVTYVMLSNYANNFDDVRFFLFNFLKLRLPDKTGASYIREQIDYLLDAVFGLNDQAPLQSLDTTEDIFKTLRKCMSKYDEVRNCAAFQKIYKLIMYGLTHSLFDKFGISMDKLKYSKLEKEIMLKEYWLGPDFIHCLIDTTLFLCERGVQCYKIGSLDPIFHSSDKYAEFFDKCLIIKKRAKQLNNPADYGFTLSSYLNDLDNAIETARAIHKHAGIVGDYEKKFTRNMLNELEMLKFDFQMRKDSRKMRETPFALLLFGDSSIGKSSLIKILTTVFAKINSLDPSDEFVYTKNPAAKYYDGFSAYMHTLVIDDAGYLKPSAANGVDPTLADVILAINPVSWCPDQASIEDKGRNPFLGKLVIASTNTENLNAFHYFACPSAVQRRFPYILDVTVKPRYMTAEKTLDSSKVPILKPGELPDYWFFTIKIIEPQSVRAQKRSEAKLKVIASGLTMPELMVWYRNAIEKHNKNQGKMVNAFATVEAITMCDFCKLPAYICECVGPNESDFEIEGSDESLEEESEYVGYTRTNEAQVWKPVELQSLSVISQLTPQNLFYTCCSAFFIFRIFETVFKWISFYKTMSRAYHFIMYFKPSCPSFIWNFIKAPVPDDIGKAQDWKGLGKRVQKNIGYPQVASIFCSILASGLILNKALSMFNSPVKGDTQREEVVTESVKVEEVPIIPEKERISTELVVGSRPVVINPEPENVWVKDDYVLTAFDVAPQSIGAKNLSKEQIVKLISNNCIGLKLTLNDGVKILERTQRAICLAGRTYLLNTHFFHNINTWIQLSVVQDANKDGVNANVTFLFDVNSVKKIPNSDLCIIELINLPMKKNILGFFAKSSYKGQFDGVYIHRDQTAAIITNTVTKMKTTMFAHPDINGVVKVWEGTPQRETAYGECGSALVSFTHFGPIIVGIHMACLPNGRSIAHCVSYEELESFVTVKLQSSVPQLSAPGYTHNLGPLRPNAHVRFLRNGVGEVYGTIPLSRRRSRSMVMVSPIAPLLLKHNYKIKFGAPVMNGWRPWAKAVEPLVSELFAFKPDVMIKAKNSFLTHLEKDMPKSELSEVMVYDIFTAVNGVPGLKFVDKMPRNTSMGHPWCKSKKFFLTPIPSQGGVLEPVEFDADVIDRTSQIILNYRDGILNHPVFTAHLKDEARSFKKIDEAATRVFTGAPVDFSIATRMYYLSIVRLIQKNKFTFMSAPGVNATSWEWHDMYNYLTAFGTDRMVAGDYKNFDKNMESAWIVWAFDILVEIARRAGLPAEDLLVMMGIAEDIAFALINFNGDLVRFFRGNPSGHPLTVIINCLVNIGYMLYCYHELNPVKECDTFFQHIHLLTYGDDNIFGVSKERDWFNHSSIAETLKSVGIVYTMADKESVSVPFIDIADCTFLKRNWRMHEVGYMVGQLDEESIEKMLMVWVKSKSIDLPQQGMAIVASAVREYFLYGKDVFEIKSALLKSIVFEMGWESYIEEYTFPTFDSLVNNYNLASSVICTQTFGVIPDFKHLVQTN
nr:MAG: polyprotein 1 [Picornavirales sp.]